MKNEIRQNIEEVLHAMELHLPIICEAVNGEISIEKLRDVHEGMEISISKLECILKNK